MMASVVTLPYGLADPAAGIGVFRRLPSGIEALDLQTGARVWNSDVDAMPIAVSGDRLLARLFDEDALVFVILDAATGREHMRTKRVPLPPTVSTRDSDFSLSARGEHGAFVVEWSSAGRYRGGAPPPPEVMRATRESNDGGTLIIDAESGRISPAAPPRVLSPEPESSMRFELTPDATVIARDAASNRELWRHSLGTPRSIRPPRRP